MRAPRTEVVAIGIDLALKDVGLIAVPSDWSGDWRRCSYLHVATDVVDTKAPDSMVALARIQRVERIVKAVVAFVQAHAYRGVRVRVGIENYAYNRFNAVTMAEVGGPIKLELHRVGYLVQPVMMQTARSFALTKVPRNRGMDVKDYVRSRLTVAGMPADWSMDVGDAWVVANYVLSEYPGAALRLPEQLIPGPPAAPEKQPRLKKRPPRGR